MAGWFSRRAAGPALDAADPRMPRGVFKLCGCGQHVIPSWETKCPACRGGAVAAAPRPEPPAPPAPSPPPPPVSAARSDSLPRPTAFHRLDEVPAAPPPARPPPADAPKRTVKLDLAALGGGRTATPPEVPAPPPPAPPPPAVKKTTMVALPPRTTTPSGQGLVIAWEPPADEEAEGWTLQGATPAGEPVTLHLRWNGEAWTILDATGSPVSAAALRTFGLVLRGGAP